MQPRLLVRLLAHLAFEQVRQPIRAKLRAETGVLFHCRDQLPSVIPEVHERVAQWFGRWVRWRKFLAHPLTDSRDARPTPIPARRYHDLPYD